MLPPASEGAGYQKQLFSVHTDGLEACQAQGDQTADCDYVIWCYPKENAKGVCYGFKKMGSQKFHFLDKPGGSPICQQNIQAYHQNTATFLSTTPQPDANNLTPDAVAVPADPAPSPSPAPVEKGKLAGDTAAIASSLASALPGKTQPAPAEVKEVEVAAQYAPWVAGTSSSSFMLPPASWGKEYGKELIGVRALDMNECKSKADLVGNVGYVIMCSQDAGSSGSRGACYGFKEIGTVPFKYHTKDGGEICPNNEQAYRTVKPAVHALPDPTAPSQAPVIAPESSPEPAKVEEPKKFSWTDMEEHGVFKLPSEKPESRRALFQDVVDNFEACKAKAAEASSDVGYVVWCNAVEENRAGIDSTNVCYGFRQTGQKSYTFSKHGTQLCPKNSQAFRSDLPPPAAPQAAKKEQASLPDAAQAAPASTAVAVPTAATAPPQPAVEPPSAQAVAAPMVSAPTDVPAAAVSQASPWKMMEQTTDFMLAPGEPKVFYGIMHTFEACKEKCDTEKGCAYVVWCNPVSSNKGDDQVLDTRGLCSGYRQKGSIPMGQMFHGKRVCPVTTQAYRDAPSVPASPQISDIVPVTATQASPSVPGYPESPASSVASAGGQVTSPGWSDWNDQVYLYLPPVAERKEVIFAKRLPTKQECEAECDRTPDCSYMYWCSHAEVNKEFYDTRGACTAFNKMGRVKSRIEMTDPATKQSVRVCKDFQQAYKLQPGPPMLATSFNEQAAAAGIAGQSSLPVSSPSPAPVERGIPMKAIENSTILSLAAPTTAIPVPPVLAANATTAQGLSQVGDHLKSIKAKLGTLFSTLLRR
eukprot:gnl/TRDRNA2_/TRDRNA2_169063_c2_seq1.p1 gnl/TRDRNA2_/TRDRNA2_169063_c2~~gnl/TRDRNA2_/TRDRNA2_169063_c2_seq1.p1  ORF type:complete len:886 (-),score=160.23 gnl/TRDRNA2_/TRDRNA2_169063_c2_seq1:215-2650(-)